MSSINCQIIITKLHFMQLLELETLNLYLIGNCYAARVFVSHRYRGGNIH